MAATCRVVRSNASENRRSISIELCPAAVGSARTNRRWHRLARAVALAQHQARQIAPVPRKPSGPIQNRFECSIVDPTVIALLGRAAATLVTRQRGAVLADCPHLPHDASRTDQKMGVDGRLARKLDVALVVAHEEVFYGYGRFDHELCVHQEFGP